MKSLDEKTWAQLSAFGDDSPLCIKTTDSSIDGVRLIDDDEKSVPYVTRSDSNNGLARFVSPKNYEFGSDDGGCITVGLDTQTAFYQPHKFVTGQNIQIITGESLNEDVAQFMVPILRQQMTAKFNWGGNGATLGRMKRLTVMLPVTDSGELDYEYMAEYTRQKRGAMLDKYRKYVETHIAELGELVEIPTLDGKEWNHFRMPEIFGLIQRGKRLKNADHVPGIVPYVSSTANNNGVDDYIEATPGTRAFGDCISLANSGSVGTAFYEPFEYVASDHVTALKTEGMSKYVYLFLTSTIEKQGSNFNFNREINDARIKNMQIMLPVTDSGEPDYAYMEQYAKNMMLRKYKQYLEFINRQNVTEVD